MALTVNHPTLKEQTVYCHTQSFGTTPIAACTRAPFRGKIVKVGHVVDAAFTGTLTTTPSIIAAPADAVAPGSGTAITGGAIVSASTNSAAGTSNSAVPTGANFVNEDDIIIFNCTGATATAGPATFYAVIQVA